MKNAMTMALSLMILAVALVVFAGGFELEALSLIVPWMAMFACVCFIIERFCSIATAYDENAPKKEYEMIFRIKE